MNKKDSKVKCTFTINGMDLHKFKEIAREQRTTPSIIVGQYISKYITNYQPTD